MAVAAYSNDLTDIALGDLNFDAGTWDESTNGGWDTGGAMVDDENLQYTTNSDNSGEAADSCTSAQYTKDGTGSGTSGPGTIIYNHNAAFTVPTDGVVSIQHVWAAPSALNPYGGSFGVAEAGLSVLIGSGFGDFDVHYVSGSDKPPAPEGGYATFFVDPTITPAGTVGTVTTLTCVGIAVAATAQARGNPSACQAIRYGRGEVEYTAGESATPATFDGYAAIDNLSADRFNLLQIIKGGFEARGLMTFGTATTAVYFKDSDKNISIADDLKVSANFNKGVVNNALSELYWTNIQIANLGTVSKYTFTVNDDAITEHIGCVFTSLGAFIYGANSLNDNVTYRSQEAITQGGAEFDGCKFETSLAVAALICDNLDLVSACKFTSSGTGHGLRLDTTGDVSLAWSNTDVGYAATNGSTGNETIHVTDTNAANTITINVSSTATIPTIKTDGAVVNVVSGQVTLTISGHPIGASVIVYDLDSADPQELGTRLATFDNAAATVLYQYSGTKSGDDIQIKMVEPGYRIYTERYTLGALDAPYTINAELETN